MKVTIVLDLQGENLNDFPNENWGKMFETIHLFEDIEGIKVAQEIKIDI